MKYQIGPTVPVQVNVKDVERSFLDEGLGVGWEPSDVETHFGPITIPSKKRECDQQKNVYKQTQTRIRKEEDICLHVQLRATV